MLLLLLLITTERAIRYVRKLRVYGSYIECTDRIYICIYIYFCHSTKSFKAKIPKVRFDKITGLEFITCHELTDFSSIFFIVSPRIITLRLPSLLTLSRKRDCGRRRSLLFSRFLSLFISPDPMNVERYLHANIHRIGEMRM